MLAVQKTLAFFKDDLQEIQVQETIKTAPYIEVEKEAAKEIKEIIISSKLDLPGLYPTDTTSQPAEVERLEDFFYPRDIHFSIKDDPNEELWNSVREGRIDREKIFRDYKSLGQTVKIEGDRGIPDLYKRRSLNLQQHFTPYPIVKMITRMLGLDSTEQHPTVADPSCGIGGMFRYVSDTCRLIGIELDEKAYHMARTLFPSANIINDNLINYPDIKADYFIINPPYSIQLEKKGCGFENAGWGDLGPESSIQSHIAELECAIKGASFYVAAMLPQGYFTNENTFTFERWVNQRATLVYRLDIDEKAFTEYGFTWPCSVVIYEMGHYSDKTPIKSQISNIDEKTLESEIVKWQRSMEGKAAKETLGFVTESKNKLKKYTPAAEPEPRITLPLTGTSKVKISLAPDSSSINTRPDCLLTELKLQEIKEDMGREWNEGLRDYTKISDVRLRRKHIITEPSEIRLLASELIEAGLEPVIDKQIFAWINRKRRWLNRQVAPFEQWIRKDGKWTLMNEITGIKTLYGDLYRRRLKQLETLGITWLWEFQKEDVARMSLKDSNLMAWSMGLGKTRAIIALALLYGVKHSLIIVEPKLKDEFKKEFKNLGIEDFLIIESEKDLKNLKKLNIIAYNKLWSPLNRHTKKTFAKAMRRRFQFICADEAHKMKAKDSKQAMAVRMLKSRYKLLSTGTPIANYPRNIFSLLQWGWGDGTERNAYGYYSPIERTDDYGHTSGYTTGTRQFKQDYITIEWVTPQFEHTLDKGMKAREMPKIKDPVKWWAMMSPKIIRRQREEPDVIKHVRFPEPEIHTELIKMSPEQVQHYKYWMDNFAQWFREQLRMEKEEGHKIDQMMVLAHLTQLQFASTIPQAPKVNTKAAPWKAGLTTKQARTMEIVKSAVKSSDKIIVFSERPEFQKLMRDELHSSNIKAHLFIGQQGIKERNILLEDFKHNGTHVLLATTTCGETGLNIPEANIVVIADTSWTPSKQIQAYSRILRPQQKKKPMIYMLRAEGSIDEYMQQLMDAKTEAINEAIDYQESAKFDPEKWLSYRDFTIRMLEKEGYKL